MFDPQTQPTRFLLVPSDDPAALQKAVTQMKRAEANRRNALKSTGPKTPEGKARSSMNAFKHGGTGQKILISPDQFVSYFEDNIELIKDLKPVGRNEEKLAQKIADLHWRMDAFGAAQMNMLHCDTLNLMSEFPYDMNPHLVEIMGSSEAVREDCIGPKCFTTLGEQDGRVTLALIRFQKLYMELQSQRIKANRGQDIFDLSKCQAYWKLKAQLDEHLRLEAEEAEKAALAAQNEPSRKPAKRLNRKTLPPWLRLAKRRKRQRKQSRKRRRTLRSHLEA